MITPEKAELSTRASCLAVFLVALPLLWMRFGHWFYLSIDEGIYLEGAQRVARGQVPYRDFFVLTGPGTFWLYGGVFHFFGATLAHARFVLCCELASMCAAISWLAGRFAGAAFAIGSSFLFLAMLLTSLYPLYITHRWDSNTFALLALAFLCGPHPRFFVAGMFAALAMWITPPMFVVAAALAVWISMAARSGLLTFLAGVALPSLIAASVMLYQGAFGAMLRTLGWDASNYADVNRLAYGALAGTFRSFWHPGATAAAVVHYSDSILPVVLPPLALLLVAFLRSRKSLALLAVASLASLLACYPRFGAAQLLFGSAFFWALCTCAVASLLPKRSHTLLAACAFLIAAAAVLATWPKEALTPIQTPVGTLDVSRRQFIQLNDLLTTVRPGDSLFVYPYLPSFYFALGAENPTRYAWLQPGMMGSRDIEAALSELQAHPPRWIIWHDFTEAFILKNWPSSDRSKLTFPEMERFFAANYHVSDPDGVVPIGYRLLERNP